MALVAGPASAVLMIPRVLDWPAGGGVFWLNGMDKDQLRKLILIGHRERRPALAHRSKC